VSGWSGVYWPDAAAGWLAVAGLVLGLAGVVFLVASFLSLGRALTPFPRPRGGVVERGVYQAVRHPIYGAILLIALGWSLAESPLGLVATALLAVLFDLKARLEEQWLEERGGAYADYRRRTPWRFVPGLY
jgi:protein-S-isoprenylcysteine O-methyltransferase Ste14